MRPPARARPARVAGRLTAFREFGKLIFADLSDRTGRLQVAFNKKTLDAEAWERVKLLDLGDIVGAEGRLIKTRTGEITVDVAQFEILSKALLPPPEKWHGLVDVETRYRQRYVDLFANPEVRDVFLKRSLILDEMRRFLRERDFVEVETPVLQPLYGGAAARPFTTHHNTLDVDLYLRISPELYLKRLLVGGMERVFEISRVFRNEGIDTRHNPEFTLMELYQAYGDYNDMMELVETMVEHLARDGLGRADVPAVRRPDDRVQGPVAAGPVRRPPEGTRGRGDGRRCRHPREGPRAGHRGGRQAPRRGHARCLRGHRRGAPRAADVRDGLARAAVPADEAQGRQPRDCRAVRADGGPDGDRQRVHRTERPGRAVGGVPDAVGRPERDDGGDGRGLCRGPEVRHAAGGRAWASASTGWSCCW